MCRWNGATWAAARACWCSYQHRVANEDQNPVYTMVVVGDADLLTPPAHARGVAECVPGAELRVLPGVGHQVMQEAPEELAALVEELVERTAG